MPLQERDEIVRELRAVLSPILDRLETTGRGPCSLCSDTARNAQRLAEAKALSVYAERLDSFVRRLIDPEVYGWLIKDIRYDKGEIMREAKEALSYKPPVAVEIIDDE